MKASGGRSRRGGRCSPGRARARSHHAVITNLLKKVLEEAADAGVEVRGIQKASDGGGVDHPSVEPAKDNDTVADALAEGAHRSAGYGCLVAAGRRLARAVDASEEEPASTEVQDLVVVLVHVDDAGAAEPPPRVLALARRTRSS